MMILSGQWFYRSIWVHLLPEVPSPSADPELLLKLPSEHLQKALGAQQGPPSETPLELCSVLLTHLRSFWDSAGLRWLGQIVQGG